MNTSGQPEPEPTPKTRILVVDDEPLIADTLCVILNINRYQASAAYGGAAALQRAREFKPDVLVSDVMMPDMNGVELAIQIQGFLPACRVVLFTGMADSTEILHRARNHGYQFLVVFKPVHPQDLLDTLQEVQHSL